jgi:hypothetical protein
LKELETHLLLSERVDLADGAKIATVLTKSDLVGKLLRSLIRAIERADQRP